MSIWDDIGDALSRLRGDPPPLVPTFTPAPMQASVEQGQQQYPRLQSPFPNMAAGMGSPASDALSSMVRRASTGTFGYGLAGLDPKFIMDPRFKYRTELIRDPQQSPLSQAPIDGGGGWLVLLQSLTGDDADSAPPSVKSQLAVDRPWQAIAADMEKKTIGPSPWFTANVEDIKRKYKSDKITKEMAEEMRQRMMNMPYRIEDRY